MPKKMKRRTRRTAEQWTEVLRRFESSGLSAREFCRREGLSVSGLQRRRQQASPSPAGRFVEMIAPSGSGAAWSVEVALPAGIILTLRG